MCDVMNKKFGIKGESATWKMIALFTFHSWSYEKDFSYNQKCVDFWFN